uniref:Spermatogenesis-defective protein 39 homolog n=1 Tax=Oryzias latipes TaxID=8090 RepID=H2MVB8_ORYLA
MGVLTKALAPPTGELLGMTDVVFFAETIEFHDGDEKNHERLVFTDKYQVNGRKSRKHLHVNADPFRAVWPGGGSAATRGGAVSPLREEGSRRPPSKKNQSGGRGATAGGRGATAGGVVCTVEMMRSKADEEEYWHSSKFKAFTFEDEDEELSRLKESKQAVNSIRQLVEEDDDDDTEKVSWSGEPVGSISWSIKEMAGSNQKIDREPAFPRIPTEPSTLNKSHSGLSLSSLFRGKAKSENFQSFSDAFSDSVRIYAPELRKPKSEYKDYVCDWSPEETVQRLLQGKAVSLEKFRSLQDKLLLLDFAVAAHDGNVITAVLIHLKRSLRKEVLFRELQSRQTALRHFIHYLTESREQKLLLELLRALGRTEDMALLQYKEHLIITDENNKRDFLKSCLSLPFSAEDSTHVQDHYTLLERQIIVEAADRQAERGGKVDIFQKFPRKASILNMPLITTLYYCCFYHYGEPEGTFSSPLNVRRTFKISEKQYFVTALAARAKLKAWSDVDALFTGRNWLGFTRKKSPLSFHRVVDVLQRNSAPTQVLQDYVALIDDAELRISLAQKLKCHDIVISTFRDMKDRQMLVAYRGKVEPGSAPERKIDDLLNNQQIRWKN